MSSRDELARAHALERQGRLADAIAGYRRAVELDAHNSDALHLLGVALARSGHPRDALGPLTAAVALRPDNPVFQVNLGNALNATARPADAQRAYDAALTLQPQLAPALRGRAVAQLRQNQAAGALQTLERLAALAPHDASVACDLGVVLERLQRQPEAIAAFERALALDPAHPEALRNLANIKAGAGEHLVSLELLDRALAREPHHPGLLSDRGHVLCDLRRYEEGLDCFNRALARHPRDWITRRSAGRAQLALAQTDAALATFDTVLREVPHDTEAHFYRGVSLSALGRPAAEALAEFDAVLAADPSLADAHNNRGVQLGLLGRTEEALLAFQQALQLRPRQRDAHINAANVLRSLQRDAEALRHLDQGLFLNPGDAQLGWTKSLLLLSNGDFAQGWPLYDARLHLPDFRPLQRYTDQAVWDGDDIAGGTLLVHAEQGLGDTLQFARYLPLLEARGIDVVFEYQPDLRVLFESLPFRGRQLRVGEPVPPFAARVPLLSLPRLCGTRLDSIPGGVPYLTVVPDAVHRWRERLSALPAGRRVGIHWQGNPGTERQANLRGRSFPLASAARLMHLPGVTLISLQKGIGAEQLEDPALSARVHVLMDSAERGAEGLADTAALVRALDLVVTSDTAMAHLAGALGVPVWVVLHATPDWRWLKGRDDSPWYPSMRLFRQQRTGDWPELFDRVAAALVASSA